MSRHQRLRHRKVSAIRFGKLRKARRWRIMRRIARAPSAARPEQ